MNINDTLILPPATEHSVLDRKVFLDEFDKHRKEIYTWGLFNLIVGDRSTIQWNLESGKVIQFEGDPEKMIESDRFGECISSYMLDIPVHYYARHLFSTLTYSDKISCVRTNLPDLLKGKGYFPSEINKALPTLLASAIIRYDGYKKAHKSFVEVLRRCRPIAVVYGVLYCGQIDASHQLLPESRAAEIYRDVLSRYKFMWCGERTLPRLAFSTIDDGFIVYEACEKDPVPIYTINQVFSEVFNPTATNTTICLDQYLQHLPMSVYTGSHIKRKTAQIQLISESGRNLLVKFAGDDTRHSITRNKLCLEYTVFR